MALRNRALVGLMLDTGNRRAEPYKLTLAEVNIDQQSTKLTIEGNKQRLMPFVTQHQQRLLEWVAHRGQDGADQFWLKPPGLRMVYR